MSRSVLTAAIAIAGAVAGLVSVSIGFAVGPALVLEMERDLPRMTSGLYPVERAGRETFAWTGPSAALRLPGLTRDRAWACAIRARAGRPPGQPMPRVDIGLDGITADSRTVGNDYQDITVTVPPQPGRGGLVLTISSEPTFVPGPGDPRPLGVQVDRIGCAPAGAGFLLPPARALLTAATSGAVFGIAFAITMASTAGALLMAVWVAIAASIPLSTGPAPYHPYQEHATALAIWIAALGALVSVAARAVRREPLSGAAQFVVAFSAATLFLHVLALQHPLKNPVDVIFHAHRFQGVLAGHYFFTQPMPSGVRFPYAIALYVFTMPWSYLTRDHVTLLRLVVSSCHVIAGALLYVMVARLWRDGLVAALAVVLFHLIPLSYIVIGNANMTYAFGQSAAIVTLVAAATWRLASRDVGRAAGLFVLAAVAFLSHVGVFPLLFAALIAIAALYWMLARPELRPAARWIVAVSVLAAVFSVVVYYGRFAEAYRTLDRVRGREVAAAQSPSAPPASAAGAPDTAEAVPRHRRLVRSFSLLNADVGWPILLLGVAGVWRLTRIARNDRLKLVLWGLAFTYLGFIAFAVAVPVEPHFQRYADEFVSRVDYATMPALAVVAALGAAWAWRAGRWPRLGLALVLLAAADLAVERWLRWLT